MSIAPNETAESYARKNELFKTQSMQELTMPELLELRELTRLAASHLVFNYPAKKGNIK
jgi:hypothetical protein